MYERFTDRARKAMALANQEAQRFGHEYLGTEHILLGLVNEGYGVGANVLHDLQVDLQTVRREVEKIIKRGSAEATIGKLPQTPRAKKVLEYSIEEARRIGHNYVGTEHLLLGLVREQDGAGARVLMNLGLKLEGIREHVLDLLGLGIENQQGRPTIMSAVAIGRAIQLLARASESATAEGDQPLATELLDKVEQLRALLVKSPGEGRETPSSPAASGEEAGIPCSDDKCGHLNEPLARYCSRCGRPLQPEP